MATEISTTVVEVLVGGLDPYEQISAEDAACEEIAAYFAAVSGISAARRGWPERAQDLDLTAGPVVTATLVESRRTPVPPAAAATGYRVAELAIDVQLDLWCAYRAERDTAARAVQDALSNRLPRAGLRLTSRGYHGRPLVARAGSGRNTDEPDAAANGEWRRTWMLTVTTDEIRLVTLPTQDTITIRPTVQDEVEADITIT